MSNEVALIPQESALTVFTSPDGLDPYLAKVRAELDAFTGDVTSDKGRKEIASMAYKVSKVKTYLESVGKDLADRQKEIPKKIDAARKVARDTLDLWKDEVRKPLTDWETAEKERVDKLTADIDELRMVMQDQAVRSSEVIRDRLAEVTAQVISRDVFGEFYPMATEARRLALDSLMTKLAEAEQRERDQAELEAHRKAAAEREAKERDERIAQEAAERAKKAAEETARQAAAEVERKARVEAEAVAKREQALKDQAAKAEQDKIEAQQRADRADAEAKARAEREQQARAVAEKAAADKRETNKKHAAKINNAALAAFVAGGLPADMAKLAVELIAKKSIPSVSIEY